MSPIIYIQYILMALAALALLWKIFSHLEMFFKMASFTLALWGLTGIVGTFQSPQVTGEAMETFAVVYGVGMLIVFGVCVFIVNKIDSEKAYQEPYDDEAPSVTYIGEPIVVDGEVVEGVDDAPTPLRRLWKALPAPIWKNPYEKVGNMGFGGTIGGDLEFAHCKKCNKTTPQKQFSPHTFVCREPGCANVNHFED